MKKYKAILAASTGILLVLLGTISCKADTADESQNTDNEKIIKDFKATDFIGEMTSEGIYVLDSRLS